MAKKNYEFREVISVVEVSNHHGRVKDRVRCPFCDGETDCYRWSLYGSGKRCQCGAILGGLLARKEIVVQ